MKSIYRILTLFLCAVLIITSAAGVAGYEPEDPVSDTATPSDVSSEEPEEPASDTATPTDTSDEEPEDPAGQEEPDEPEESEETAPELSLSDKQLSVTVGSMIQIKCELKSAGSLPESVVWSSDSPAIATVDGRGVVTGVSAGRAKITAAVRFGEDTVSASCEVNVTAKRPFAHFFLSFNYEFSKLGDYYYSDNSNAWQRPFGFIRLYDIASQLIGYQYDFARVVFNYGNKDWLVEFWKGQYALFQYGGEIGVYTKYATGFGDTVASVYNCAGREDWLDMEMTLYQQQSDGSMIRVFTRDYGKYWWCDGYRIGRIQKTKPAAELQMVSRITLKDETMAAAFAEGMKSCGFTQISDRNHLRDDTFFLDGSDVYFIWRNLTESQNLIPLPGDVGLGSLVQVFFAGISLFGEALGSIFSGLLSSR